MPLPVHGSNNTVLRASACAFCHGSFSRSFSSGFLPGTKDDSTVRTPSSRAIRSSTDILSCQEAMEAVRSSPVPRRCRGPTNSVLGWYIPSEWADFSNRFLQPYPDLERYMDIRNPRTPAEAAHMALELCMRQSLYLEHTKIPLIIHQTWKEVHTANWTQHVRDGVEAWLSIATGQTYPELPKMAYVLWDDDAVDALIQLYEQNMWTVFKDLPRPVEKADIFRIAVLRWFGGIVG